MSNNILQTRQVQDNVNTSLVVLLANVNTQANSSANTVKVMANSAGILSNQSLNFINTSSVQVSVVAKGDGNANIGFTALSSNVVVQVACSDLITQLVAGSNVAYCRSPRAFTLSTIRASLLTAATTQGNSNACNIQITMNGANVFSTLLTINQSAVTSVGANIPAVIANTAVLDDALLQFNLANVGTGATGLIVTLEGN